MAMYFLLPHIKEFEARHSGLSVWISTRMVSEAPDFTRHDVVITRGSASHGGVRLASSNLLFKEQLTVVSAASLLDKHPLSEPADVCSHTLIASSSRPGDWEAWFARAGVTGQPIEGGHHFDHLFVALHAVRDGLGSTIAPRLFFNQCERYALTCPLPEISFEGFPDYAHATASSDEANVASFLAWLSDKCSSDYG